MAKNTQQQAPTPLSNLGEFGLIKHLTEKINLKLPSSIKGIGDDAAVLDCKAAETVVTTDMLVEGVHFDLLYTPLKHLGYKAVVVNLSDIYAMNATPTHITVSIGASNRISVEALEDLYEGIQLACERYNVDLIGGDTTSAGGLVISVTAIGKGDADKLVYRSGAREHDLVCVTGDLGAAYMGLQLLEREKKIFKENEGIQPDFQGYDYVLERQLKPEARQQLITLLAEKEIVPTSMIDVSDGLSSEILHICDQSGVGCSIYEERLPIDTTTDQLSKKLGIAPVVSALNGGEDYELLFTIDQKDYEKIKGTDWISVIGHITAKGSGKFLISRDEQAFELTAQGWDALNKRDE